jgi:hypothetical protein
MRMKPSRRICAAATVAAIAVTVPLVGAPLATASRYRAQSQDKHVLLISVDGLHAFDVAQWVREHPSSNLAKLSSVGTTYSNAADVVPTDSFPGVLSLLTGGSSKSNGVYYDDAFARDLWAPGTTACATATAGTEVQYAENLDKVDAAGFKRINASIDPSLLAVGGPSCQPVYPHTYLRTNTIFNVADDAGLPTAWADKHPAYDLVNGHPGGGVSDLYTPEINMDVNTETVNAAGYALNVDGTQSNLKLPEPELNITDSEDNTQAYDNLKVTAVLNQIRGMNSTGTKPGAVPAILGMNFQSVSVGQKLVDPELSCVRSGNAPGCDPNYMPGGYVTGTLEFTPQLASAMRFVDDSLGKMAKTLLSEGLAGSTKFIISAKHGQSPINPAKLAKPGDVISPILTAAGVDIAQITTDDTALIWLKDQSQVTQAVTALEADRTGANTGHIQSILSGAPLAARYNDPAKDPRTPDIIIQPIPGTIYSKSKAKVAEHGGGAEDDTHVALLVVDGTSMDGHGGGTAKVVDEKVSTKQVAPTVLGFLDLDARKLDAVRAEGTHALPMG